MPPFGVLALQGDFAAHAEALLGLGVSVREIRRVDELAGLAGLVLPGGESSTLLNLMGGLDTATSGSILFEEKDLTKMKRSDLAFHRRFSVGMVFQTFNLIHYRSALENVSLAITFGREPRNNRKKKAAKLLSSVGLEHRLHHKPAELSGGEAQRVAVARALANSPKVLLADEPTGNLDSATSKEIVELLQGLNQSQKLTVIMVTHEQDTAEAVSDKVIRLLDGKIEGATIQGGAS